MENFITNDVKLTDLQRLIFSKCNFNFNSNVDIQLDFFEKEAEDIKLQQALTGIPNDDILYEINMLHTKLYESGKYKKIKIINIKEFLGYTDKGFAKFNTQENKIIFSTMAYAVVFTQSAYTKFLKKFTDDDITLQRFYQMYNNAALHGQDNFYNILKDTAITWSSIQVIDKLQMLKKYPGIKF